VNYPEDERAPIQERVTYWLEWDNRYGCPSGQMVRRVIRALRDLLDLCSMRMQQIKDLESALRNANIELKRVRDQRDALRQGTSSQVGDIAKAMYEGEG
jgi:hypothetical protein